MSNPYDEDVEYCRRKMKKAFEPLRALPNVGDFVRVTNTLDMDYGKLAEVEFIGNDGRPGIKTIHLRMNPLGGGVQIRRPIDLGCFEVLTEMEVLAESVRTSSIDSTTMPLDYNPMTEMTFTSRKSLRKMINMPVKLGTKIGRFSAGRKWKVGDYAKIDPEVTNLAPGVPLGAIAKVTAILVDGAVARLKIYPNKDKDRAVYVILDLNINNLIEPTEMEVLGAMVDA